MGALRSRKCVFKRNFGYPEIKQSEKSISEKQETLLVKSFIEAVYTQILFHFEVTKRRTVAKYIPCSEHF